MAPLRDAVRLVDDEQADLALAHGLEEPARRESLGRDVEQAHLTCGSNARSAARLADVSR